jgi:hypothetical protein
MSDKVKTKIKKRRGIRRLLGSVTKTSKKKVVYHDRHISGQEKEMPTVRKVVTKLGKGVKRVQKYYADGTLRKEKVRGRRRLAKLLRKRGYEKVPKEVLDKDGKK